MAQEHESLHTLDSAHRIHHGMHNHLVPALLCPVLVSKKNAHAVRSAPSSILTFQAPLPPSLPPFPLDIVALTPHHHRQASRLPPRPPLQKKGAALCSLGRCRRLSLTFVTRFKGTHCLRSQKVSACFCIFLQSPFCRRFSEEQTVAV